MYDMIKGISDTQKGQEDKNADNARANLQILSNSIQNSGLNPNDLSAEQKLQINKLELQAGLPINFLSEVTAKNPKADVVSMTDRIDPSGGFAPKVAFEPKVRHLNQKSNLGL
jgi:hypothetical protein